MLFRRDTRCGRKLNIDLSEKYKDDALTDQTINQIIDVQHDPGLKRHVSQSQELAFC